MRSFDAPVRWGRLAARKMQPHYPTGRGHFAKHFDKDDNPSETLICAKQERFDNWHALQELAGII